MPRSHSLTDLVARVHEFDARVDRALDGLRGNKSADRAFYAASELGDFSLIWHLVGAARGITSDRHADEAFRLSAVLAAESLLINGVVKSFFRRRRPAWDSPIPRPHRLRQPRSSSFPSGHASAAFTAATLLAEDDPMWPLYYAAAAFVASSRTYVKIHHASDVVAGALTGMVLGRIARRVWPKPE
ncbi:MAG TPA: phosphatase PAP2 family protein [Acidimicrobiales bacterium]|nr:phosphatase PAP2 family protein [Acidimicrobiales bacterium]